MKLFETARELVRRDEIKDMSKDLLSDLVSGLLGDPVAIARAMKAIVSSPFFIREQLFWQNFERFLNGIDDCKKGFSEKISEDDNKEENAKRIIRIIDDLDTDNKVDYIINATIALCKDKLSLDEYFRVCRAIENCYISDLKFVKLSYDDSKLYPDSITVQDLTSNGLMDQVIYGGGSSDDNYIPDTHMFTELAYMVYKYAIIYGEE